MTEALQELQARFSIRWRLIGLVVLVGVGMLAATAYVWQHEEAQRAAAEKVGMHYGELADVHEMQAAYTDYRYWLVAQLAAEAEARPDWQAQARVRLELARESLGARLAELPREDVGAAGYIRSELKAIEEMAPVALAAYRGRDLERRASLNAELRARLEALNDSFSRWVEEYQRQAAKPGLDSTSPGALDAAVLTSILSFTVLFAALLIRSIVRPLEALLGATDGLTRGELDTPLPQERPDEIGAIARALHQFRENAKRSTFLAYHEPLSGLPNRSRLQNDLMSEMPGLGQDNMALVLLYIGLEQLNTINETFGPAVGDEYIRLAARRLRACAPEASKTYHMGGSHFVVVAPALANDARLIGHADRHARNLVNDMSRPFTLQEQEIEMSINVGVATWPQDGSAYEELIGNAHAALTHARRRGRNQFQFYTRQLTDKARSRLALANQLKHAVEAGEFTLHYQPVLDVVGNEVIAAEALMRWHHPQRGLVMPGEFIEVAEETGVINAMGEWCLAQACLDSRSWRQAGIPRMKLAVNLSARQLNEPGLVDTIEQTLQYAGVAPADLELEITESAVMQHPERSVRVLRHLKSLGITLSIDDFGTGYSSLAYLQRFPLDKIKIDRSFVARINRRRKDELIIAATAGLAADLGLQVVAEGVETAEQLQILQQLGCRFMQGFYFSRAIPPEDFVRFVNAPARTLAKPSVN